MTALERKILNMIIAIVSPAFPPYSGVGGVRMYSLANYLQDNGHSVIVFRNSINSWGEENCKSECNEFYRIIDIDFGTNDVLRICRSSIDAYKNAISDVIESEKVDLILYSCSPFYNAITAVEIKKEYGIKTIIDYRDLWINEENYSRNILRNIKKRIFTLPYGKDERKSIIHADRVITVTPEDCSVLRRKYKKYAHKIEYIYNGYDEKRVLDCDLIDVINYSTPKMFIGVFGKFAFYDFKYAVELLKAIQELNELGYNIKLVHIGKTEQADEKAIIESGISKGLYVGLGYMDYSLGIKIMEKAIAGCVVLNYQYVRGLGTKVFDYIMINKPIIYFAKRDSALDRLLKDANHTYRCEKRVDAINSLKEIIDLRIFDIGMEGRDRFSRLNSNKKYESIINDTIMS